MQAVNQIAKGTTVLGLGENWLKHEKIQFAKLLMRHLMQRSQQDRESCTGDWP